MAFSLINRSVSLLFRIFDTRHSTVPIIKTVPQKPAFQKSVVNQPFLRVTPESQDVPSEQILSFFTALRQDRTLFMHNLMILRNGCVLFETSFGAQDLCCWKSTFSACKSITSLAIGMLIDEGQLDLDTKLIDLFSAGMSPFGRLKLKDLTVRHLLNMTSGVLFNEFECMTKTDWVSGFLNSAVKGEIGKTFGYNSLNTYMLSAIVRKVSGTGLTEYLTPRLFAPLGITSLWWEKCPAGIEKGGWGLYILPEDIAKIGQLIMDYGRWNGRQLVSEDWIRQACAPQIVTPESCGDFNYGYQIWSGRKQNTFLLNGMFGQNVLGFRDSGILIVSNAGNEETFQQSSFFMLAHRYFSELFDVKLKENPKAYRALAAFAQPEPKPTVLQRLRSLFKPKEPVLPSACHTLCGRVFIAHDPSAVSVGLFPVMLQALQNNYTRGIRSLSFAAESGKFTVHYQERDEKHSFAVGFVKPETNALSFHGEPYLVAVSGSFTANEDGRPVLKLRIDFLETACTRLIKLVVLDGAVLLRQSEMPGKQYIVQQAVALKKEIEQRPVLASALSKLDTDFILYKIEKTFEPNLEMTEESSAETPVSLSTEGDQT